MPTLSERFTYQLANMHGPTVYASDDALAIRRDAIRCSLHAGLYRVQVDGVTVACYERGAVVSLTHPALRRPFQTSGPRRSRRHEGP